MKKAWNRAERSALCAFATARRAEKNVSLIFHLIGDIPLYTAITEARARSMRCSRESRQARPA